MILKASQRSGAMQLARHLFNAHDNDHVELHELRGFVADDLAGAFKETHAVSLGTKCTQFLFSLSLNPPELENVPVEDFEKAINSIEKKLGLAGQPRAIVFHEKSGRRHAHCVWSRIDANRMRAINLSHFKMKLQDISRELYLEHNWKMPRGLQNRTETDSLNYSQGEGQQAKRVKTNPQLLKKMFQQCWERSDSKAAFAQALKENGFILSKGDRRGFVAVDTQGEVYSVSRWVGIKAKEVRSRLGNYEDLPNVEEAHGMLIYHLSENTNQIAQQIDNNFETENQSFEHKRLSLIKKQRQERDVLRKAQQKRKIRDNKDRKALLPTGLKASWFKVTGQYQKALLQIKNQLKQKNEMNRAESQQLRQRHLKERRNLQQQWRQFQLHHDINIQTLWKDRGTDLSSLDWYRDQSLPLPAIDPRQSLILPDELDRLSIAEQIQHQPETILEVISDKKEFFSRNDIVRGLANYIEEPLALNLAISQVLQSKELVEQSNSPTPRFTTLELKQLKISLANKTKRMATSHDFALPNQTIRRAIDNQNKILQKTVGANLSQEQVKSIHHILGTEQLSCVVGYAGAGKSTMLAAAREGWEHQGYRVIGATLSGKAADGLESSSGIQSRTLASLEYSWKHGFHELHSNDIVVIDEAGMVGTKQLTRFIDYVQQSKAKLVLVGDPEQLQPIQAGTPFKDITEQVETTRLTEIRRQKKNWQCEASVHLATQNIEKALITYEDKGFVKRSLDTSGAISSLVADCIHDIEQQNSGSSRLALAHRRKDVHLINQSIRSALQAKGKFIEERLYQTDHGKRAFAKGERILFTRNDKALGLRNGMLGTVEKLSSNKIAICIDSDNGKKPRRVTIEPQFYGAFDHGYATTIHKSQGATVDRTFVLASTTMDRHLTYVAMTRHREDMRLYGDERSMRKISRSHSPEAETINPLSRKHHRLRRH